MSEPVWHKGAPPSIGWWPAGYMRLPDVIRWYDGKAWSMPTFANYTADEAADCAFFKARNQASIEWTERWWV